jgi:hypothetical protein
VTQILGLFTEVPRIDFLGSSHPAIPGPMPQSQAALTFAQWGTPPEGPPFPSMLVSKHIPSAKKTPICSTCKGCQSATARYNFDEPGLPISPPSKAARLFYCLRP